MENVSRGKPRVCKAPTGLSVISKYERWVFSGISTFQMKCHKLQWVSIFWALRVAVLLVFQSLLHFQLRTDRAHLIHVTGRRQGRDDWNTSRTVALRTGHPYITQYDRQDVCTPVSFLTNLSAVFHLYEGRCFAFNTRRKVSLLELCPSSFMDEL